MRLFIMTHTVLIFAYRKPGTTPEQFKTHYEGTHVPLVKELAGEHFPLSHTRRYIHRTEGQGATERNAKNPATVLIGEQVDFDYDAFAELTFADVPSFQTFMGIMQKPENAARIAADEELFLDRSRCRRMGLQCVLASTPGVRQTKAQLQRQLESLRHNTNGETASPPVIHEQTIASMPTICSSSISPTAIAGYVPPIVDCSSRELDGQVVEARKIRGCFDMFFDRYVHLLPLLDPHLPPDGYYDLCPFLFWAIVYIGSRKYSQDPTLLHRLSSCINTKALLALESRAAPIQTIQGLLLLCLWPVPINTAQKDLSSVLSGAAMALAMQIGLHVAGVGQEFARAKLVSTRSQKLFRAQLWMHCIMICNSEGLIDDLPSDIRFSWEMHKVLIAATAAMLKQAHPTASAAAAVSSKTQPSTLSPFINLFDAQLTDMVSPSMTPLTYHFLEPAGRPPDREGLLRLYAVACSFIQQVEAALRNGDGDREGEGSQNHQRPPPELLTTFVERTLTLAAICILKVQRSSALARFADLGAGETAYFSAILLVRGRASVANDDLGARAASILGQLWTSRKVFVSSSRRDGGGAVLDGLETKTRGRLSMSVVFDSFWWWREEFDGRPNPYKDDDGEVDDDDDGGGGGGGGGEQTTACQNAAASLGPLQEEHRHQQFQDDNTSRTASEIAASADMLDPFGLFSSDPFPDYDWAANVDFNNFDLAITDQLGGTSNMT
ncbi:hypothetical protein SLS62_000667 [Diatrype stigma]|uniref:EthD domain-containing protein n=1 Tax=Diatrype stigma TaxID=117547 RepID=A0AAN9V2Y2_9PEZI